MLMNLSDNYIFITINVSKYLALSMVCSGLNEIIRRAEWNEAVSADGEKLSFTAVSVNTCTEIAWHHQCWVITGWRPVISAQLSTFLERWPSEFMCMDTKLYQQGADGSFVHYAKNKHPVPVIPFRSHLSAKHIPSRQKNMKHYSKTFFMIQFLFLIICVVYAFSVNTVWMLIRNDRHFTYWKTNSLKCSCEEFKDASKHESSGSFQMQKYPASISLGDKYVLFEPICQSIFFLHWRYFKDTALNIRLQLYRMRIISNIKHIGGFK